MIVVWDSHNDIYSGVATHMLTTNASWHTSARSLSFHLSTYIRWVVSRTVMLSCSFSIRPQTGYTAENITQHTQSYKKMHTSIMAVLFWHHITQHHTTQTTTQHHTHNHTTHTPHTHPHTQHTQHTQEEHSEHTQRRRILSTHTGGGF